jgi:hypothetical protein
VRLQSAAHTYDAVSVEAKTMMQPSVDAATTVLDDCTASDSWVSAAAAAAAAVSADEDDMVTDPDLNKHLAHWGINMLQVGQ